MNWLPWVRGGRRRSPFNNWGPQGLTCGRVTSHLLVGGELGPHDWRALEDEGVSVVINLQEEQQDIFRPDEHLDASLWLPSPDGLAPTLEQLTMGVDLIESSARAGRTVFVHCKAGQGRAPLLCACYLIRAEKLAPLEAVGRVREARARTQLTPEQNVRLREYAALEAKRDEASSQSNLTQVVPLENAFANENPASSTPFASTHKGSPGASPGADAAETSEQKIIGPLNQRLQARASVVTPRNGHAWHEQTAHAQPIPSEASDDPGKTAMQHSTGAHSTGAQGTGAQSNAKPNIMPRE